MEETVTKKFGLNSFWLRNIAMALMLCDHLWATLVPGNDWLTWIGRIAFPIFAFMIAEGYAHTKNFKKYLSRMLAFAVLAEIPFNLMCASSPFYPFHQNVLWTFALSLLCIKCLDKIKSKKKLWLTVLAGLPIIGGFMLAATVAMTDYGGYGLLTVIMFWIFRGKDRYCKLAQLIMLVFINFIGIKGLVIPVEIFGLSTELPCQGFAVLAMVPILLYNGTKGADNKLIRFANYAFYPAHMLILWFLSTLI